MAELLTAQTPRGGDDSRSGMTRRAFAAGSAVSLMLAACTKVGTKTATDDAGEAPAPSDPAFLALSRKITGHDDLDPIISNRTAQAFRQLFPDLAKSFAPLGDLARASTAPAILLGEAVKAGHGEAALAVVAAWYTGTVGKGVTAQSIAYADALMNRPVADALFPPTYQLGGPAWWTAAPPTVDHPDAAALQEGVKTLTARALAGKKKA